MADRSKRLESLRRKQKYKEILERGNVAAEQSEGHSAVENLNIVESLLIDSNKLISEGCAADRIGYTTEVLMDVQVVKMACDLMGTAVQQIDNVKFSDEQYAAAIKRAVTGDNGRIDWSRLERIPACVIASFKYTPAIGDADVKFDDPVESQSVTQKVRQVRKRAELATETKPMALTQEQVGTNDTGTKKLKEIINQIKTLYEQNEQQPIPYYQLIIDPKNMMNTFDNGFQLSFLFRDGMIGFLYDDEQMPAIRYIADHKSQKPAGENKQFIAKLNSKIIGNMIKKYKIKEPMLRIERELYDELDVSH